MLTQVAAATVPEQHQVAHRNTGGAFDAAWVDAQRVNRSAVERRVATLAGRRTVKKQWQAAWLLRAIQTIDLTTLAGDDTPGNVQRLCQKALHPVRTDLLEALGVQAGSIQAGAVCVYHALSLKRLQRCVAAACRWQQSPPASLPARRRSHQRVIHTNGAGLDAASLHAKRFQ